MYPQAVAEFGSQRLSEIAVDFDRIHTPGCGEQRAGQCPQSRPDFNQAVTTRRCYCGDDCGYHVGVDEKILSEPFARAVFHQESRRGASVC
jgi:hypothetical protein